MKLSFRRSQPLSLRYVLSKNNTLPVLLCFLFLDLLQFFFYLNILYTYFFFHRDLYEEMDNGIDITPIQFGLIAKLDPIFYSFLKRCSHILELFDNIQLAQIIVFPYNYGYNIYLFFVHIIYLHK